MLAAEPILSEFVASNDSTLNDGFGDDSDWVELYNAGDEAVDLQGYYLTDDATNLAKWEFPASTILGAGEYLVVFASGDDTLDPEGNWHTNFKLSAGGEYLGLANPDAQILSEFGAAAADYPPQITDVSYGVAGPAAETLLAATDNVQFLKPLNNSLGETWTQVGFDWHAHHFVSSQNGIGYENSPGDTINYTNQINTTVSSGTRGVYIRSEFEIESAADVIDLNLSLIYDDGFAAYLNGTRIVDDNAPASISHLSLATGDRNDAVVLLPVNFSLNEHLDLLQDGDNVLAIHALNRASSSDMLLSAELDVRYDAESSGQIGYLASATPGGPNAVAIDVGPVIDDVEFSPELLGPSQPIVVTARVSPIDVAIDPSKVKLHFRLMFGIEVALPMNDSGQGVDAEAGDGVYSGRIPGSAGIGEMIRWYITAEDVEGTRSRAPRFAAPLDSAEYFGTVVLDPTASDDVPVMYWFVENEAAAETRAGTRGSLYYLGEFYDNIQTDLHGQSTAGVDFPKKSFDFDSNTGQKFRVQEGLPRHSDFNLLANYADQSKVRNFVAYSAFAATGGAHHLTFPVSVHRNGQFYGLYDFVEQGDSEHLRRLGIDPDGALYKVNNDLEDPNSATQDVQKLTRKYEDHSDLEQIVLADDLTGLTATRWDYDHFDIADMVNYLAVQNVIQNGDFGHKNMYLYRDSNNTKLWQILPWDVDLSFGHLWRANVSPPYFSNQLFTTNSIFTGFNDIIQRLYSEPRFREMYGRRLKSVSDQLLGAQADPVADSWAYQQFELWDGVTADEAIQDANKWGIHPNFTHTPEQAVDQIQNSFITARRNYINAQSIVPDAHSDIVDVSIGVIEHDPSSGDEAEEYFVLENHESFATDISGWTIAGAANHTFKPGTVIPAGETLYVVADVQGFLGRTTGPRGGLALHLQGNYSGQLSDFGGALTLRNANGTEIDQASYAAVAVAGDYNRDGAVNAIDYAVWRETLGSTTMLDADGNGNGVIDQGDYDTWRTNFGATFSAAAAQTTDARTPTKSETEPQRASEAMEFAFSHSSPIEPSRKSVANEGFAISTATELEAVQLILASELAAGRTTDRATTRAAQQETVQDHVETDEAFEALFAELGRTWSPTSLTEFA